MATLQKYLFRRFTHPLYPTLMYLGLGVLLSTLALRNHPVAPIWIPGLLLIGTLAWTLVEYILHRFVFHLTEIKEPWRNMASGLHMEHHHNPDSPDLIVAPPLVSFLFASLIFGIFWAVTRNPAVAALLICGLFAGYCFYEWVHYAAHQYPMRSLIARHWKKYHLQHHHKHPNQGFGVTSSLWDHVFRTFPS
jgi:Fatty acid hydroxylase superfamily.